MEKIRLYFLFSHKLFVVSFLLTALPFALIKIYASLELKELAFMFIAVLALIKFYLAKAQSSASLQNQVKKVLPANVSKQEMVDQSARYKRAQDMALALNLILILMANIFL